jgi:DNA-binding MarR family transcriptional regulator
MQRSPKAIVERARADELDSDFSTAITRLYRRLRAQKADDQIGDSHRTVLAFLVKDGPRTLRELSDHEHVTPPSMNQTVNALAEWGYVARSGDPDDGRKVILAATPEGAALIAATRRRRYEWLNARLETLSVSDRKVLSDATGIINKIADS